MKKFIPIIVLFFAVSNFAQENPKATLIDAFSKTQCEDFLARADNFFITPDGRIIAPIGKPLSGGMESGSELTGFQIDLTSQREKHFTGLKPGSTYYFYYYVVNSAGVSPLSTVVSIMCW